MSVPESQCRRNEDLSARREASRPQRGRWRPQGKGRPQDPLQFGRRSQRRVTEVRGNHITKFDKPFQGLHYILRR